jgi:hypothetical protein
MERQKRTQIGLGDPNDAAQPVHDEVARVDPSADGTGGDLRRCATSGIVKKLI